MLKKLWTKLSSEKDSRKVALACALLLLVVAFNLFLLVKINLQACQERKSLAIKVTRIMELYDCNDKQIHQAIMETFDPVLVAIVVAIESEFQVDAVSPAGCRGLMQLSPGKLEDWKDVRKNIRIGARYLQEQVKRFDNVDLAIAAYNAGPESVIKYQGVPPFRETQRFINKANYFSLVVGVELSPRKARNLN